MNRYEEKARALFAEGANCAQAVFAAFSDVTGIDEETARRLASPFGGGMGRMREVCGAISGMLLVLGNREGYAAHDDAEKARVYATVQMLAERFREEHGSIICRELLGGNPSAAPTPTPRTEGYYKKRPCGDMVGTAARILAEHLGLS